MSFLRRMLMILIPMCYVSGEELYGLRTSPVRITTGNLKHLSWNILAPIWIDKAEKRESGLWDMNLFNDDTRLELIINRILETNADIVTLQEVQEDVFSVIRTRIFKTYNAVPFAPHVNEYWKSFLPEGVNYVKNGVATFFKRKAFLKMTHNSFALGIHGNTGLAVVLRPRRRFFAPELSGFGSPVIVLNYHLESGFTVDDSKARVQQGTALINEANRILTGVSAKFPRSKPVLIIAGDLNSFRPFPGFANFDSNGYLDVMEESGNSAFTLHYSRPMSLPGTGGQVIMGATLDHVFVRKTDITDNRITINNVKVPDITSDELEEDRYIQKVTENLVNEIRRNKVKKQHDVILYLLQSKIFNKLQNISKDDNEFDTNINRVLRLGSDHFPMLIEYRLTL